MSPLTSSMTELAKRATYTITEGGGPYYYSNWQRRVLVIYAIALLAVIVLSAIGAFGALIVWYFRERKRKQLYGPMAQYYRDRGFGRTGFVRYNGAMYVPQVIYVPHGGQPQQPFGPTMGGPLPGPGMIPYGQNPQHLQYPQYPQNPQYPQYPQGPQVPQNLPNQGQSVTPGHQSHPQLQPINTSVAQSRSFGDVYGVSTGDAGGNASGSGTGNGNVGDITAGISQRDIEGPISPIRDFNGTGSHDPFASPHVKAYPILPPQAPQLPQSPLVESPAESSSRGARASAAQTHGITEVHGGVQQMSEKGDVGLTRSSNTLSFYAIPVGSQPNVSGAGAGKSG